MPWTMDVCLWWPYAAALGSTTLSMTPPMGCLGPAAGILEEAEVGCEVGGVMVRSVAYSFSIEDSREWAADLGAEDSNEGGDLMISSHSSSSSSSSSRDTALGENLSGSCR